MFRLVATTSGCWSVKRRVRLSSSVRSAASRASTAGTATDADDEAAVSDVSGRYTAVSPASSFL